MSDKLTVVTQCCILCGIMAQYCDQPCCDDKEEPSRAATTANSNCPCVVQQPLSSQHQPNYQFQPRPRPRPHEPQHSPSDDLNQHYSIHMPPPIHQQTASAPPAEVFKPSMSNSSDPSIPLPSYSEAMGLKQVK